MKQASLPASITEKALARDKGCVFTGDSGTLVATWIFPPFLGYTVSKNNPFAFICGLMFSVVVAAI